MQLYPPSAADRLEAYSTVMSNPYQSPREATRWSNPPATGAAARPRLSGLIAGCYYGALVGVGEAVLVGLSAAVAGRWWPTWWVSIVVASAVGGLLYGLPLGALTGFSIGVASRWVSARSLPVLGLVIGTIHGLLMAGAVLMIWLVELESIAYLLVSLFPPAIGLPSGWLAGQALRRLFERCQATERH